MTCRRRLFVEVERLGQMQVKGLIQPDQQFLIFEPCLQGRVVETVAICDMAAFIVIARHLL